MSQATTPPRHRAQWSLPAHAGAVRGQIQTTLTAMNARRSSHWVEELDGVAALRDCFISDLPTSTRPRSLNRGPASTLVV